MSDPLPRTYRQVAICVLLFLVGCAEERPPETFSTTTLRGQVVIQGRPVPHGWVTIQPAAGNQGNLRVAPLDESGRFVVERVPTGKVLIALDNLPVPSIRTPKGELPSYNFRMNVSPIERELPVQPGSELPPIDLYDEASRRLRTPRRSRRGRGRTARRKANGRTALDPSDLPDSNDRPNSSFARTRILYRDGQGEIHLDWPVERLPEALNDLNGSLWVDIEDLEAANNSAVEGMLRDVFHFHPLALEDALKDTHVPKVDDWSRYLYVVVNTVDFDPESDELRLHELDIFLGKNYVLTYHKEPLPLLEHHRRNIEREPATRMRHGSAHLLYRLLDEMVDEFLPAIEHLDNVIDDAQDEVFRRPTSRTLRQIFHVKRNALHLHRVVIPMREVMNRLARDPYGQIPEEQRVYFRDIYDHLVRIHDIIESLRDLIGGALDTYLSVVSNRTNDTMKYLTIVNVMFLPMSFVASFFGMNFFADTLAFTSPPLPRTILFWGACVVMFGTPMLMAFLAWRRRWFS